MTSLLFVKNLCFVALLITCLYCSVLSTVTDETCTKSTTYHGQEDIKYYKISKNIKTKENIVKTRKTSFITLKPEESKEFQVNISFGKIGTRSFTRKIQDSTYDQDAETEGETEFDDDFEEVISGKGGNFEDEEIEADEEDVLEDAEKEADQQERAKNGVDAYEEDHDFDDADKVFEEVPQAENEDVVSSDDKADDQDANDDKWIESAEEKINKIDTNNSEDEIEDDIEDNQSDYKDIVEESSKPKEKLAKPTSISIEDDDTGRLTNEEIIKADDLYTVGLDQWGLTADDVDEASDEEDNNTEKYSDDVLYNTKTITQRM